MLRRCPRLWPYGGNRFEEAQAKRPNGVVCYKTNCLSRHGLPREEQQTGALRQCVEQVLPRAGKNHKGLADIRVGRWTGSMGEGLAIGFDSIGAKVIGDRMAGLLGAIYDYKLPASGIILKLPTERLMSVEGAPRENFVPKPK